MSRHVLVMMCVFLIAAAGASAGTKLFSGSQSDTEGAVNSHDSYGEFAYEDCGWLMSGNGNYTQLNFSFAGDGAGAGFFPFLGQADAVSAAILTYAPEQPEATTSDMVRFRLRALDPDNWSYVAAFDIGWHGTGTFIDIFGAGDGYIELGNFIADFFPTMLKMDITETDVTLSASDNWGASWTEVYSFTINDATSQNLDLTGSRIAILANAVHSSTPWKIDSFEWTGASVPDLNLAVDDCNYGGGIPQDMPAAGFAGLALAGGLIAAVGSRLLRRTK